MNSNLVRKIEKAKDYAVQPQRVTITKYTAKFRGDNDSHEISYEGGKWKCSCFYFSGHETCSHIMAMQMMLGGIAPEESVNSA